MYFQELGKHLRSSRKGLGLTQEQLAKEANVSRVTVNQLENGMVSEIGSRKLLSLLDAVGLDLVITPKMRKRDYLKLACTSANVSYRDALTPDELAYVLITGNAPATRRPQLRVIFDEVPDTIFEGVLAQIEPWAKSGRVRKNAQKLAIQLDSRRARSS
jgi:transcriptional regulator with XRE-family HTH domain